MLKENKSPETGSMPDASAKSPTPAAAIPTKLSEAVLNVFNDLAQVRARPAFFAAFLNYLIQQNIPSKPLVSICMLFAILMKVNIFLNTNR